jgi:hypothetical protein
LFQTVKVKVAAHFGDFRIKSPQHLGEEANMNSIATLSSMTSKSYFEEDFFAKDDAGMMSLAGNSLCHAVSCKYSTET